MHLRDSMSKNVLHLTPVKAPFQLRFQLDSGSLLRSDWLLHPGVYRLVHRSSGPSGFPLSRMD